jgi:ABC-type phosphate transport system substrate-binding protein
VKKIFLKSVILVAMFLVLNIMAKSQSLTVIANPTGVPASMNMAELKKVYKAEKLKWDDGTKIVLAMMQTSSPVGKLTCDKIYAQSPDAVAKFWLSIMFRGQSSGIKYFTSEDALRTFVDSTPGAIGIVSTGSTATSKKVKVDGKDSF